MPHFPSRPKARIGIVCRTSFPPSENPSPGLIASVWVGSPKEILCSTSSTSVPCLSADHCVSKSRWDYDQCFYPYDASATDINVGAATVLVLRCSSQRTICQVAVVTSKYRVLLLLEDRHCTYVS